MIKARRLIAIVSVIVCALMISVLNGCSTEGPTEPTAADIEEAKEEKESGGEAVGEAERESGQSDNEGGDGNGDN
jgi:hypothetical protein